MRKKEPSLLPLAAMARRLNIKPADLRVEAEAGTIPFIRVGGSLLFEPRKVEATLIARAAGERSVR